MILDSRNPARMTFTAVDQVSPINVATGDRTLRITSNPNGGVCVVELSDDNVTWVAHGIEGTTREFTATGDYQINVSGLKAVRAKCTTYVSSFSVSISST